MAADTPHLDAATAEEIHRVQRIVQVLLRSGLVLAVVCMAVGLVMKLVSGSGESPAVKLFALGAADSRADTVMGVGVLILALTPAFRVLALVVLWARERDWRFVGVALAVIVTLALAVVVGHG